MTGRNDPRTIFGWAMYDWANSAYITAGAGVLFPIYFASQIVPESGVRLLGRTLDGEGLWGAVVGFGAFVLFLAMPVLGAVADLSGAKRRFLQVFAYGGATFTVLVVFVGTGQVALALAVFLISFVGFVAGNVMYNAFLPEITTDDTIDAVSAKGFAFGYAGGGLQLLLAVVVIAFHDRLGIDRLTAERIGIAMSGVWWGAFSVFALARLPRRSAAGTEHLGFVAMARAGFGRTLSTTRHLVGFRQLLLFVVAFLLYNDGVQTVIALTSVYASETLGLATETILVTFLVVQFVAVFGAVAFGWLARVIGPKRSILIAIGGWVLVTIGGYRIPEGASMLFIGLGAAVGLVLGGVQALSRSLYGSMIPQAASAEFFGFFSVFSKFSAIWGPLLFAVVDTITGSARLAIGSLVVFLVLGGILLAFVDVEAGRRSRERWRVGDAEVGVVDD